MTSHTKHMLTALLVVALVALAGSPAAAQPEMTNKIRLECAADATPGAPCPSVAGQYDFEVTGTGANLAVTKVGGNAKVGIGTTTPISALNVKSQGTNAFQIVLTSTDNQDLMGIFETGSTAGLLNLRDSVGNEDFRFSAAGDNWIASAGQFSLNCTGSDHDLYISPVNVTASPAPVCGTGTFSRINAGSTTFTVSSSRSIKENLNEVEVPSILDRISQVRVYNYDFVEGPKNRIGLMAEDFHQVFERGSEKLIDGQEVEMALWLAVQELDVRNKNLESTNAELKERNEALANDLATIKDELLKRLQDLEGRVAVPQS